MRSTKTIFLLITLLAFTSCKTYEVKHFKGGEIDKSLDVTKDKVYIHAQKGLYKVTQPSISKDGVAGDITPVKDPKEAEEIRDPGTPHLMKKHRHDLNIFTKTEITDSTKNVTLKKNDITEYSVVITHSNVKWDKVGDIVKDVLGVAVCIVVMGALVYWFSFI
jgi:hypothetical protein